MIMNSTHSGNCTADPNKWPYLLLLPLPVISVVVNLTVAVAATIYRKKLLRQSYVYISVISTLLSNIMFLCLHLWEESAFYRTPESVAVNPPPPKMQTLWSLCTSAWIALLSAVCGNLTTMIYVLRDSNSFQTTIRNPSVTSSKCKTNCDLKHSRVEKKRRRALLLLAFTWMLPLCLTIAAVVAWNCADVCNCSLSALGELCPLTHGCSRVWPPMKNSYIAVNVAIWFVEVAVLMLVSVSVVRSTYGPRTPVRASTTNPLPLDSIRTAKSTVNSVAADASPGTEQSKAFDDNDDVFHPNGAAPPRRVPMNPRMRLAIYLSALFAVCTCLIPVSFFADISGISPLLGLRISSMVLVQLYTLICPVLLVRYLSSLKLALVGVGTSIQCCCK